MTIIEAMEYGRSLPESIFRDYRGRPALSRADWEKLGRWRRLRDVLLGWDPPKEDPAMFPPFR